MALLGRDISVTGSVPDGTLLLETFHGIETLGRPYVYRLTLLSENPAIAPEKVLGQPLTVEIRLDNGSVRYFNGVVIYFAKTGLTVRYTRYAAELRPRLALLDYTRDCRIYFNAKGPELAAQLLSHAGGDVDRGTLKEDYRKREYCVQYRESHSNFIQRLFEEEGVYYFFKHAKGRHTMVLADSESAHRKVEGYESIPVRATEHRQAHDQEHFWSLNVAGSLYPGKFTTLQGYDHSKARLKATPFKVISSGIL